MHPSPLARTHGIDIIDDPQALRLRMAHARAHGKRIAFVPTMGYLHEGHVSLLRAGRARGDLLVLSIFVNPMQFGANEDLSRYPRDLDGDLAKAATAGCDIAFCPQPDRVYPPGFQTRVEVTGVQQGLCGDHRPGHFAGVATVVLKLINVVQPHVLLLGEKDYQQLMVIRRMVRDLELDVEVLGCPLIRDGDGLALSSRNAYLSSQQRQQALVLSRALFAARDAYRQGTRDRDTLFALSRQVLASEPALRLEYLDLRDADTLEPLPATLTTPAVMLVAGHIGRTRLIDNVLLDR